MRVAEKGQVAIPKGIRDQFGIGAGSEAVFEAVFEAVDCRIVVRKLEGVTSRGDQLAARLRGRGDIAMTTDEIMSLTRGE